MEFEPSATALEKEGAGYVVASLGVDSGYVPYTSYSAKDQLHGKNPEIIQKFTDALQKGKRYYDQDTWKSNLIFREESFELLEDILEDAGELKERVPYENLVTTEYAAKAVEK